ncbi:MAG: SpoVA/SpoVAEb family sporulation membrane protein [Firmicutes bacterium]|nr:SpoVA/SpoVAEb family sporulation membrane protein [Bacillota bacterium]
MPKKQINASYAPVVDKRTAKIPVAKNCLKAFFIGGLICMLGEILKNFFIDLGMQEETAVSSYLVVIIGITAFFTAIGKYDNAGQFAGAGLAVPISGFANSVSSSMLEYRSEGFVLGMAANAFKLAGCVIVWGSVSAFILACIDLILEVVL